MNTRYDLLIIVAVIWCLGIWSWDRNKVWRTEIGLMSDCVRKSPNKERPWSNLSAAYLLAGDYVRGRNLAMHALTLPGGEGQYYLYYNLSIAYAGLGDWDLAYINAHKAALMHKDMLTMTQLGKVLRTLGYTLDSTGKQMIRGGQQ